MRPGLPRRLPVPQHPTSRTAIPQTRARMFTSRLPSGRPKRKVPRKYRGPNPTDRWNNTKKKGFTQRGEPGRAGIRREVGIATQFIWKSWRPSEVRRRLPLTDFQEEHGWRWRIDFPPIYCARQSFSRCAGRLSPPSRLCLPILPSTPHSTLPDTRTFFHNVSAASALPSPGNVPQHPCSSPSFPVLPRPSLAVPISAFQYLLPKSCCVSPSPAYLPSA